MNQGVTDDSQITELVEMFNEYEKDTQNIINEQQVKIASLSDQVKNLSEDNKTLRIANDYINVKLANHESNNLSNNCDINVLNKIKSIVDNFKFSGFLKTASYNDNINEFISEPNNVLNLLEDITDTFVDLGLISDSLTKTATAKISQEADFISNNIENNKNADVFLTSNTVKNAAASNYEDNLRKQLKTEIQVREEAFLNNLNKSNY